MAIPLKHAYLTSLSPSISSGTLMQQWDTILIRKQMLAERTLCLSKLTKAVHMYDEESQTIWDGIPKNRVY